MQHGRSGQLHNIKYKRSKINSISGIQNQICWFNLNIMTTMIRDIVLLLEGNMTYWHSEKQIFIFFFVLTLTLWRTLILIFVRSFWYFVVEKQFHGLKYLFNVHRDKMNNLVWKFPIVSHTRTHSLIVLPHNFNCSYFIINTKSYFLLYWIIDMLNDKSFEAICNIR